MIWRLNQVPGRTARGKGRLKVQELWSGLPEWLPLPAGRLIPAIIQDAASGMVLMLVDLNQEALELMSATGRVHYYHPAKRKVVAKGEAAIPDGSGATENRRKTSFNDGFDPLAF